MNRTLIRLSLFLFGVLLAMRPQAQPFPSAPDSGDIILYNARIFTADSMHPRASAIAIREGKILAVGELSTVKKAVGKRHTLTDMKGGYLLPGLIDSHIHTLGGGRDLGRPNLMDEALELPALHSFLVNASHQPGMMTGDMLYAVGANISTWSDLDGLRRSLDSGALASLPVLLEGSDGHTCYANAAFCRRAGLDRDYILSLPVPSRHFYNLGEDGSPTGFAADSGMHKLFLALPDRKKEDPEALRRALDHLNSLGITAFLDPHVGETGQGTANYDLEVYAAMDRAGDLTAHMAGVVMADANADAQPQIATVRMLQDGIMGLRHVSLLGFKVFADGVVEFPTQTAALSIPYLNSGYRGDLLYDPAKFRVFTMAADKAGLLVHTHAIGDRAVTETLNGIEAARKANGNSGIPHAITHLQFVLPADIPRFASLNVPASVQLLWAFGDVTTIDIVKPYVADVIYRWQYPARSLRDAGALLCGASDLPVSSANPFEAISRAETRLGPKGVLDATQCLPRKDMFLAYTINAARSMMMDTFTGSLEAGKSADMILVDRDVMNVSATSLRDTRVLWTMFEGKIIFPAGKH
jgi:predicted amidohydrolase YtcJ